MTTETTNKLSPEVRASAARLVQEHEAEHASCSAAITSIAANIGCSGHSLNEWIKKYEVDSGARAGVPSDMAEKIKALERENRELRQANEILRKASTYFAQAERAKSFGRVQEMIGFIDKHREDYRAAPICRVLPIAPSTYHDHVAKRRNPALAAPTVRRDIALQVEVDRVFSEKIKVYGVRKVWQQLRKERKIVARCTVDRLMRSLLLQGVIRGKPIRTTFGGKTVVCPLNRVNRDFSVPRPNSL